MQKGLIRIFAIILPVFMALFIGCGCFDVGAVKNESEYCEVLTKVVLHTLITSKEYNMSEYYNKDAIDNLDKAPAPADKYCYFCVKAGFDFNGGDMGLHYQLGSGKDTTIHVDGFVLTSAQYATLIGSKEKVIPPEIKIFGSAVMNLKSGKEWGSFLIDGISKVEKNGYIVLRFNEALTNAELDVKFKLSAPVIRINTRG